MLFGFIHSLIIVPCKCSSAVFKFVEHPENNEKQQLNQKSKVKFKIMSLKVKPGVEYVPELVCCVAPF